MYNLNYFSKTRYSWFILFCITLTLECSALVFQHILGLAPCVMCIYERVAMIGISGAALIGFINPTAPFFRITGLIGWGFSSAWGLKLALQHVEYQLHPSPFSTCDLFVKFPSWAPLNKWIPWMFEAYGDCSKIVWEFLTLSMPQWLIIIFASNLVAFTIITISQFYNQDKR